MYKKPLLIAGVDPGTTTGLALLRLDKKVFAIQSSRNLGLDRLIEKTMELGSVLVVGCDKANVPELVDKYRVRLGAKVKNPREDLKIHEKKELVGSIKTHNDHEFDALASALFAYKEVQPLLRKIQVFLKLHKREDLFEKMVEVCVKEQLAISLAFDILVSPKKESVKMIEKFLQEPTVSRERLMGLYEMLAKSNEELHDARLQFAIQKKELEQERARYESLTSRSKFPHRAYLAFSNLERKKKSQAFQLDNLQGSLKKIRQELATYELILGDLKDFVVMKKVHDLGFQEFLSKVQLLKIKPGDIVFVANPAIVSEKVLEMVQAMELTVVFQGNHRKGIGLALGEHIKVWETSRFAFCEKTLFEAVLHERNLLQRVVTDYQLSRR